MLSETLSPEVQVQRFAEFAQEQIEDAKNHNRGILGRVPSYTVSVDGRVGAPLTSVRPNGYVIAEFELLNDVLHWIREQLESNSPVLTGQYKTSHVLFADGNEVGADDVIPLAEEYIFTTPLPYARKIERGQSSQAPDGVYQGVAVLASQRFGNIARIKFSYRAIHTGSILTGKAGNKADNRNPAIVITLPR
jgi:hypothetical protein